MAVYKRSYSAYTGQLTPRWSRFLILTRYSARSVFQSRIVTALFVLCFVFPLIMIAGLYLNHNPRLLSMMRMHSDHFLAINGEFFRTVMSVQASLAFLMTAFIGPGLVAPDLANNALPLYFCRPLSRAEYVLGRACVLLFLLSLLTWVPGLALFGVETSLVGFSWAWEHIRLAVGVLVGSVLWISILTLLALALSAWVRWKIVAGGLLLGVMFASGGFGAAIAAVLNTSAGFYLDPAVLVAVIYTDFFDVPIKIDISPLGAYIGLIAIGAFCILLLSRKIRAFQVVR
jgi:ABC-2 type transport system permease protein